MAIKFDELLEALDPSLDKLDDKDKKLKEARKSGKLNNIDRINKKIIASCDPESTLIEVLNACGGNLTWAASDLGLTLSELDTAIDYYGLTSDFKESYKGKKLKEAWEAEFESAYDDLMNDTSLSEKEKDEALKQLFAEFGFNESLKEGFEDDIDFYADEISHFMNKSKANYNAVCDYIDNELRQPNKGIGELNLRALKELYMVFIEQNDSYNESLNESKSSESILNELGDRIATGLRKEGFDAFFDYPGLTVMNTSYGLHVVNTPSVSVEDTNGKQIGTYPINTQNASTEAVSNIVKTIVQSLRK